MLKVLINRYNPKTSEALLKFLPSEEMKTMMAQDVHSNDITPLLFQPQKIMESIHYSWIKPLIQKFSPDVQNVILGALTPTQTAGLQHTPIPRASVPVKNFMIHQLYSILETKPSLPLEYLPETDLSPLVKWSKKELVVLIDFLGLYDLASEIRYIVDKRHLENIYSCLSRKQTAFLKICLYQKEKLASPKLGINPAEKNSERLKALVHQRGLIRLSKAFAGQHPDLIWYLAHQLDMGRGKILLNYYSPQAIANVTSILKLQVNNVINFLKKSKP